MIKSPIQFYLGLLLDFSIDYLLPAPVDSKVKTTLAGFFSGSWRNPEKQVVTLLRSILQSPLYQLS